MAKKNTITLPDGTVVSHKKPLKEQMYKYRFLPGEQLLHHLLVLHWVRRA